MVCLIGSSGHILNYQTFAIISVQEIGVTPTISNVHGIHICTVLSPRLKHFSFTKVVAFQIAVSRLTLLCDLLILSSYLTSGI